MSQNQACISAHWSMENRQQLRIGIEPGPQGEPTYFPRAWVSLPEALAQGTALCGGLRHVEGENAHKRKEQSRNGHPQASASCKLRDTSNRTNLPSRRHGASSSSASTSDWDGL